MRKEKEKKWYKKEEKKIMRKELGLKRREREVEGGNIKKKEKKESEHVV